MESKQKQDFENDQLYEFVKKGDVENSDFILEYGIADPNYHRRGEELLLEAAIKLPDYVRDKMTTMLIERGADIHAKDEYGRGILHRLATWDIDTVKNAIALGADVNDKDNWERTPLHHAGMGLGAAINTNTVQLFIEKGVDINAQDKNGNTLLHYDIDRTSKVRDDFLRFGADPNIQNEDGNTPLHLAACYGEVEDVELLMDHGADTSILNNAQRTAAAVAREEHKPDVVHSLETYKSIKQQGALTEGLQDILNRKEQEEAEQPKKTRVFL